MATGLTTAAKEAGASKKPNLPSRAKSSDKTNIGFTFVDQSGDLKSLADKRIVSSSQRHAIRSHVMKSVRHSENLIGKKRPTGRENSRRPSTKILRTLPFIQCEVASIKSEPELSLGYSPLLVPSVDVAEQHKHIQFERQLQQQQELVHIPPDPAPHFDPFYSLPGGDGPSYHHIEVLVHYCFDVFLPMTFPVERNNNQGKIRHATVLQFRLQNQGSFFGFMATVAAHRAITSGRHRDLRPSRCDHGILLFDDEYAIMKDYAIRATRAQTAGQNSVNADWIEATSGLISAATIIGNLEEARIHLEGMRQNLTPHNEALDPNLPSTSFIPMSDVKAAVGMLSKPLFAIPWDTASTEETTQLLAKSTPKPDSPLSQMGVSFLSLNRHNGLPWDLSPGIQRVLRIAIAVCWVSQLNADSPRTLDAHDHELFRRKSHELEHGMLDYCFDQDTKEPIWIHPVENLIRLTAIGMVSSFISQALPSAGLGRAITHNQLNACESLLRALAQGGQHLLPSERRVLVWALCQFVHAAANQPEEPYFLNLLSDNLMALQIETWENLESLLFTFLYVPAVQRAAWFRIWEKAEALWKREGSVTSWRSTVSPDPPQPS